MYQLKAGLLKWTVYAELNSKYLSTRPLGEAEPPNTVGSPLTHTSGTP